jgi:hypothetical protein
VVRFLQFTPPWRKLSVSLCVFHAILFSVEKFLNITFNTDVCVIKLKYHYLLRYFYFIKYFHYIIIFTKKT